MSVKLCCCLCCTPCNEYKLLQNEIGESNEIYEMTVKYFDPIMLLTDYANSKLYNDNKVLCQDCWLHIKDFNEFQQTVMKSRTLLEESVVKQLQLEVKLEEEHPVIQSELDKEVDNSEEELDDFEDVLFKVDLEDNDALKTDSLSGMGNDDNESDDDNDDDDIKPLMELKKNLRKSSSNARKETNKVMGQPEMDENDKHDEKTEEKTKSRRGRKPKDSKKEEDSKTEKNEDNEAIDKPARKKRKLKDPQERKIIKKNPNINSGLEKGRESDEFIAEWKPFLECDLCSETFSSFDLLKNHYKEKHNSRCYIKCCERKFYRRCVLIDHIRLHINPETHKCDLCGKHSSTKYNLKLHKKIVHEVNEKFECDVCHRFFTQKPNLERHLLTHVTGTKNFFCKECDRGYVLEIQLKSHIKTVHTDKRVCDQCGKTIHGVGALKKHLMEHAGIERPKYPCDECGAQLRSRGNLRRHKAAYHNDGTTIYVCSICGKVAGSEYGLLTHKKHVHQEERKHKCTYCDKAFKRPKFLREHVATHTGQDLYQCPHCPQTFKVSSNMHHHRKKAHPVEFEEGRKNRLQSRKVDISQVTNQVVI